MRKYVAGVSTVVASVAVPNPIATPYRIALVVDARGDWFALYGQPGALRVVAQGSDAALATGGALASGKPGILDWSPLATTAVTRRYDNFTASVPPTDAACFAGQSAELRHSGFTREDAGGTVWDPKTITGDYLLIPPAGREGRSARIIVKPLYHAPIGRVWLDDRTDDLPRA